MNPFVTNVMCASVQIEVADVEENLSKIISVADSAIKKHSSIVTFPELAICGCSCGEMFSNSELLDAVENSLEKLRRYSAGKDTLLIVGAPLRDNFSRLLNCAVLIQDGFFIGVVPKIFSDSLVGKNFFASPDNFDNKIKIAGKSVLCGQPFIFEDMKSDVSIGIEIGNDRHGFIPVANILAKCGAKIILNISANPETVNSREKCMNDIRQGSLSGRCAYIYNGGSTGESSTDFSFGNFKCAFICGEALGSSSEDNFFVSIDTEKINSQRMKDFSYINQSILQIKQPIREKIKLPVFGKEFLPKLPTEPFMLGLNRNIVSKRINLLQQKAIIKKMDYMRRNKIIIGVSGGIDSTVALLSLVDAYKCKNEDLKNIIGVTMPGPGTTKRTYENSKRLMTACKITQLNIPINDAVKNNLQAIRHNNFLFDITYEQTQSRERTKILMDLANKEHGIVVGTGDMSELALGWMTYSGDQMSMYSLNGGVPKTVIRHIAEWRYENANNELKKILEDILTTPVSPELLPVNSKGEQSQETEKLIGPYVVHDFFLYCVLKYNYGFKKILSLAQKSFEEIYKPEDIKNWLEIFTDRFFTRQYKRTCYPDGLQVYDFSLSPRTSWQMPADVSNRLWKE